MNKLRLLSIVFTTVFLAGCTSSPIMTRSADEILATRDSRLMRGIVDFIVDDEQQQIMWAGANEFEKALGYTPEHDKGYQYMAVRWYSNAGNLKRKTAVAHPSFKIKKGDIVDFYSGQLHEEMLRNKETVEATGAYIIFGIRSTTTTQGIPYVKRGEVVGVVCRATESDCRMNSRQGTEIGIGRRMSSAADYHGVEAESTQPMYKDYTTVAEFLNMDLCFGCDDDKE